MAGILPTRRWIITLQRKLEHAIDLADGEIKFELNDGWAWNLGYNKSNTGNLNDLFHDGDNIAVTAGSTR